MRDFDFGTIIGNGLSECETSLLRGKPLFGSGIDTRVIHTDYAYFSSGMECEKVPYAPCPCIVRNARVIQNVTRTQ